jgi:phenylpropionate dioxygenase-like ring-hydroxylating dioxygenase large terminal subunit
MTVSPDSPQTPAAHGEASDAPAPRAFVARPLRYWYILALSSEVGDRPIARTLFGRPIVLFRGKGGAAGALVDRCPHRNVPLSIGRVDGDLLECAYHGWRFDTNGACRAVPCSLKAPDARGRRAGAHAVREQSGFVWVYGAPDEEPANEPHRFMTEGTAGYTTVRRVVEAQGTLSSTLENALDVPHTAFLHRGLFRSKSRGITIGARVHRAADRVTCEYVGEPRPPGLVARVLSPSGGTVTHFDRFILPSIAQVEYRIGEENHLLVDSVMTPVDDFVTRIYAVVSFKMRLPGALVRPVLEPLALRVFEQDAEILGSQTANIRRFGEESFVSTEIDVLGRHIRRLLRAAERGEPVGEEKLEVELEV